MMNKPGKISQIFSFQSAVKRMSLAGRRSTLLGLALAVTWGTCVVVPNRVEATSWRPDAASELVHAVRKLNTWLRGSDHAEGWRRFLLLNALETQAAMGNQADLVTLSEIEARFGSSAGGLESVRFTEVRDAIQQLMQHIEQCVDLDISNQMAAARSGFQPIGMEQFDKARDKAYRELSQLKAFYRHTILSRPRADAFAQMQLDDALTFVPTVVFEPAPEVSVGQVESQIRTAQGELREITQAIDALPTPEENQELTDEQKQAMESLQQRRQSVEQTVADLRTRRGEVLEADRSRRNLRATTFRRLLELENSLGSVSKDYGDPFYVSTMASYQQFVRTYFYGTADTLEEDYQRRLDALETELARMDGDDARDAAGKIGDTLQWLENANQAATLVTAVRTRYSQPNAYVFVSGHLINQVGSKPLYEVQPVKQNVGGKTVQGTATTLGTVMIDLVDDPNQVHASIHLVGNVHSDTYLKQGPLTVFTQADGMLEARRSLYANVGGLFANPAYLAANFQACLAGTSSRLRIINRIVEKKFSESRQEGEGTAARQAEDQLRSQFNEQTDQALVDARKSLAQNKQDAIDKSNLIPPVYVRSTRDHVLAVARKDSAETLAAPSVPVDFGVGPQIGGRIHETMISNFLERTFAGKTFTDKELATEIGDLLGEPPAGLTGKPKDGVEPEPFSITFASIRPIQFEFDNQVFRIVVSGRKFSQGNQEIDAGLKIILQFKIQQSGGTLKLVRDGKVEFDYADPDKTTPKIVAFRSFLDGRLNKDLEQSDTEKVLADELLPIDRMEALQNSEVALRMRLVQFRCEGGWLYLGWNYLPEGMQQENAGWNYDLSGIWPEAE